MRLLDASAFDRLSELGEALGESLRAAARRAGVAPDVIQIASVTGVAVSRRGPFAPAILDLIVLELLNRGFKAASMMTVSTATATDEIRALEDALTDVLRELRPAIAAVAPAATEPAASAS